MLLWAPMLADPPMLQLSQLHDGTYSLEDIIDMNLMLQWKADQVRKAQGDKK